MNRPVPVTKGSTIRRRAIGGLAVIATIASTLTGLAVLQRPTAAAATAPACSNTVDWTTVSQPARVISGKFTGGNSVTLTLGTAGGNSGLAFGSDWSSNTATSSGVVGGAVTNKEAMAIYGTSGGNTVDVEFAEPVTNPVVYVNYVDANTELDFGSKTVTVLDSNPTATLTGNKVGINGGNGGDQGFAARVTGTFSTGANKLSFTYKTGNDTMGISFSFDDTCPTWCVVPFLAQGASAVVGGVTVTASSNTAKDASILSANFADYYWSDARDGSLQTRWSFSSPVQYVRVTTLAHADAGSEQFDFTGKDGGSSTVLTKSITNKDTTETYRSSTAMSTFQSDFTPTSGNFGSLVKLEIGAPSKSCTPTCDFIPYGAQGTDLTVGDTKVTVTQSSAVTWGSGSYWLFVSDGRRYQKLTFDPPITELSLQTAFHADSPGGVENFALTLQDAAGADVFATNIKNADTTKVYAFSVPVKTLEATFTPQNGRTDYGSLIRYKIPSGPGACGPAIQPPPPPVVTADSGHVYYGKTTPTIGSAVAPTTTQWTTAPTCRVYATDDASYTTPLSGVLEPGDYVTHCAGGVSNPVLTVTYVDGTFVVDSPYAITATSYTGANALTYPGTIPTIGKTIDAGLSPDITTQPTCAVFSEDWGGFDVPTALTTPLDAGTYVTRCHSAVASADPDRFIRYIAGELVVNKATTTIAYNGDDFVLAGSTSLNLGNTLTAPAGCTGTVTYSLDDNPTTATIGDGPYTITSPVSTSGWLAGAYVVTVSYPGDSNCESSTNTATITAYTDGAGWGGGWYSSGGKNTFGFVVQSFERNKSTPAYTKGQVAWQSAMWRFKGTLNAAYSDAAKTKGTASGTGTLWYWQKSGATGTGVWVKATGTDAAVTISYEATTPSTKKKQGNPGKFGISFTGTPATGVPSLPTMANPLTLNEGNIRVA